MYVYDDEDNSQMLDDQWEAERERSAQEMDERWAAEREKAEQKKRDEMEGLLDMLGLEGSCRDCYHITETAEGFLDNGYVSTEQIDYLHILCVICGGRGKGNCKPNDHYLDKDWSDRIEWVKGYGMKHRCLYCPNVYRIYGQYKDPDDEWKAIEDLCGKCKYFGEE